MKAIIKAENSPKGLMLTDKPLPTINHNQVLIKIKKTAICGTDIHIYNWDDWAKRTINTPQIIGHEFVGEVVEVGMYVTNVRVGQLVSGEGHIVCGRCRHCITGEQHLCRQTLGVGVNRDGVFAEYIAFPASNVWVCDENIAEEVHSLLDPLGNATHSALSFNVLGEDVLVTGAGPIGLMSVPILKRAGARSIVVSDINPGRLELAKELGATTVVDVRSQTLSSAMAELDLIKEGFDVGLEMSGSGEALNGMIDVMANGGKVAILGILPQDMLLDWNKVVFNSLTLKGIYGRKMFDTWYRATALLQSGLESEIAKTITHRFSYMQYEEAFELMVSGGSGKIILEWS